MCPERARLQFRSVFLFLVISATLGASVTTSLDLLESFVSPPDSVSGDCFSSLITPIITGEAGISVVSSLWAMHLHAELASYSSPISQLSSCSFLLQRVPLKIPPTLGKFFSGHLGCGVGPCVINGEAAALLSFHLTKLTPVHTVFQSVPSA